jgi:hypothetical protein
MKHWEIIADNLSKAGWSWCYLSSISQQSGMYQGKLTPFGGVILGSNPSGVAK